MELISQHAKKIMEECKSRARDAGLSFDDETLEYIVSNRDLLELTPKHMIPTLYDYWLHDVIFLQERGKYELYPHNPYETVINSRPAISFYNDNNPDWLNVMIFYHVLAHIDFFQNNHYFRHTWDDDFVGQALADKRLLNLLRSEHGRWVDYVIEFGRAIDNLSDYYHELSKRNRPQYDISARVNYYFDHFIQDELHLPFHEYLKEIERYNKAKRLDSKCGEDIFFAEVRTKYPEFEQHFLKFHEKQPPAGRHDVMEFVISKSPFLQKEENQWMKTVLQIIRKTSLYFQPQIRTKIINEGWASYWHEKLFMMDERVCGHEVDFARVHAKVTALPTVGINPYAIGMRLFQMIEEKARLGRLSYEYDNETLVEKRKNFHRPGPDPSEVLFQVRENENDFSFISRFVDQDFVDRFKLFVTERRLNSQQQVWEYVIKSRNAEEYRQMLLDSLYHPPHIQVDSAETSDDLLRLTHRFEGKQLIREYIQPVMLGLEYLWGAPVELETTIFRQKKPVRVIFRMENQHLSHRDAPTSKES
ncbi:MAG: SpoVR family protein [Lentisphaerae bacterium]|nr:MAG: SpoVR family protein [Lentisphaerota bacterium]